ncbi:MAG: TIGR04283 family arsenosugar biosynthesis glycosyltransferase [Chloroflexi bacterium]|nr:TIGR04283 family arsenosugar biosynthesis glycosyltransferase [Chloroflexota bacterium]
MSIVIPVLDESSTIASTLESVLSLEGDYEVVVVDGGSTDDTVAIAGRYARVLASPRGRATQMNVGAREVRGDVLLFLHADTVLPPGAMAAVEHALADPRVVGGRFKVRLDHPGWAYRVIGFSINMRDRLLGGFTGDQAIFVLARVFQSLGGYREMPLMEDLEFGKRMARAGKVARLPLCVTTSARRWQKNGVLRTILLMWMLRFLFILHLSPSRLKRLYGETR